MRVKSGNKKQHKTLNKFSDELDDPEDDEEVTSKWYDQFQNDPAETTELQQEDINKLKDEAKRLYDSDLTAYAIKSSRSSSQSDLSWMKTVMSNGTTSDKIAACTLLIQTSPIHNLSTLNSFINLLKLGKKECQMVIETLRDLFLSDLLPPDRKLRVFAACPLSQLEIMSSGNQLTRTRHLVRWYFEDQLKEAYYEFLVYLNAAARDTIEANKEKAISSMYKLLANNPEREAYLLSSLVNKLGDPSQKIASKTIYCLTQLLQQHPAMKTVIMEEIEKLIFRSNISRKTQYYGVCFLSQFYFSTYDGEVAKNIIRIYFSFFKSCVKKGDVDTRMMRILLNGVNRAFPFVSKENDDQISEHIDMLYKIVHVANYNVSLHALCLIYQVSDYSNDITDRFYSALYKKLSDPKLASSSHHAMFLSLLFRALKTNQSLTRGRVFIKRMLQACNFMPPAVACGILFLTSQLIRNNRELLVLTVEASPFGDDGDDEEECYKDVLLEEEEGASSANSAGELDVEPDLKPVIPSWFHVSNRVGNERLTTGQQKRNPQYAGGEHCSYTELVKLSNHFHPTVSLFASKILGDETIQYSGDPLQDFTLMRFLDRFVFKNPKKLPPAGDVKPSPFARKKSYTALGLRSLAVNSSQYLSEVATKIPVDEMYMYSYLQGKRAQGVTVNNESKEDEDSDDTESVNSEDFDHMMDGLMGGKQDLELDFADDIGEKLANTDKKKASKVNDNADEDDEEEDDSDDGDNGSEEDDKDDDEYGDEAEDIEFGDDGEDNDFHLGEDFDINDMSDMSDEEEVMPTSSKGSKKKQLLAKYSGRNNSIFASADEFAELLEESGASGLKMAGSNAMANKDNAGEKQMKWEVKRNEWMTDDKWKGKKGKRKRDTFPHKKGAKKIKKK